MLTSEPVLTGSQRRIYDQVKAFVLERRKLTPSQHVGQSPLAMVNDFPARDRQFIGRLAEDLHLSVAWDEFDEEDRNLVTWRFPGELEEPLPEDQNGKSEHAEEDEEGRFYGGGLTSEQKNILNIFDKAGGEGAILDVCPLPFKFLVKLRS